MVPVKSSVDVTVNNETKTITIPQDSTSGTATFSGLTVGETYSVSENNISGVPDGYTLDTSNSTTSASGTVAATSTASLTNAYKPTTPPVEPVTTGSLTVTKTFSGTVNNAAPDGFTASFQLEKQNGDAWTNSGSSVNYSSFSNGAYTFDNLVPGTYRVTETITSNGTGIKANESSASAGETYFVSKADTSTVAVAAGTTPAALTITNTYAVKPTTPPVEPIKTGTLTINKAVTGVDSSVDMSNYSVTVSYANTSKTITGFTYDTASNVWKSSTGAITLDAGTTYTVTETAAPDVTGYTKGTTEISNRQPDRHQVHPRR
jgi:hypothetical protein